MNKEYGGGIIPDVRGETTMETVHISKNFMC